MATHPPLRIREADGDPNGIPVFDLIVSNGTLTILGGGRAELATGGASGAAGAPTDAKYVVLDFDGDLDSELRLVQSGNSITITTAGNLVTINAVTSGAAGTIYAPSGGRYITLAVGSNLVAEQVLVQSGDSITVATDGDLVTINAITSDVSAFGKVYAPTGGRYLVLAIGSNLLAEQVLVQSGDSTTVTTDGSLVTINATTGDGTQWAATGTTMTASTGLTGGGDLSADREFSVNTNIRDKSFIFYSAGNITGGRNAEDVRVYVPFNMQPIRLQCALEQSSIGANSMEIEVNQHASPDAAAVGVGSVHFVNSAYAGSATLFGSSSINAGYYLGFQVTDSGGTSTGSNLTITLVVRAS